MSESRRRLNVAMIGAGFIAGVHSNAFNQVSRFFDRRITLCPKVVCGRDPAKLEAFAEKWGWEETSLEWESVVGRPDIDIVDIAVPDVLHARIALAAAKEGKIIFCEKPLALSVDEARNMCEAVGDLPNLVWFSYRRVPAVALAKRLIEEGRLGRIFHYRASYFNQSGADPAKGHLWRYRRAEAGSGATADLLSHCLDTAVYLNGEVSELTAMTHTFADDRDVDDAAIVMTRFSNGSLGSFEASRFGIGRRNGYRFEVYGAKGNISFDLEDMNRLQFFDATEPPSDQASRNLLVTGPDHPYWSNFWKPGHLIGYEHTFIATLADFLKALEEKGPFHPNFEDALGIQKIMDAIERSAGLGRWVKL